MQTTKNLTGSCGMVGNLGTNVDMQKCAVWSTKTKFVRWSGWSPSFDAQVDHLPRVHGSGLLRVDKRKPFLFLTLAPMGWNRKSSMVWIQSTRNAMHHYNFPQYSVGETIVTVRLVVVKLVTVLWYVFDQVLTFEEFWYAKHGSSSIYLCNTLSMAVVRQPKCQ